MMTLWRTIGREREGGIVESFDIRPTVSRRRWCAEA